MWRKIQCDGKSWKVFGFRSELNNAVDSENVTNKIVLVVASVLFFEK